MFSYYQVPRSLRMLNSAQYGENCQNWPKLTFRYPATATFFPNFEKPKRILKSAYQTASEKNAGSEILRHKFKNGHPSVTGLLQSLCILYLLEESNHFRGDYHDWYLLSSATMAVDLPVMTCMTFRQRLESYQLGCLSLYGNATFNWGRTPIWWKRRTAL